MNKNDFLIFDAQSHNDFLTVLKSKQTPIIVRILSDNDKRRIEQNKYYFGHVLKTIAQNIVVGNAKFSRQVWHEYFAQMFVELTEICFPNGEKLLKRKSTAGMTTKEFTEYLTEIEAFCTTNYNIEF